MSSKYILGTLAIAGGVYYYDRNVQPIIPRNKAMVEHDVEEVKKFSSDVQREINERIEEQRKQMKEHPSLSKQLKETKLYQNLSHKTGEYNDAVNEATTPQADKNILSRGVDKYIDAVNSIGDLNKTSTNISTVSPDKEIKQKSWGAWLRGDKRQADKKLDDAVAKAEATKSEWLNWGSKKTDDASAELNKSKDELESKKNEWFNWGSQKSDKAAAEADNLRSTTDKKANEWSAWGSKKADEVSRDLSKSYEQSKQSLEETKKNLGERFEVERQRAIENYEKARANLEELTSQLQKSSEPDKNAKLEKAKADFQSSISNLKAYGDDVFNDVNSKFKELGKK